MIDLNVPNVLTIAIISVVAFALLRMIGGAAAKKAAPKPAARRAGE